jgi:hypothetical protein
VIAVQELEGDQWSALKKGGHLDSVRREVNTLRKLRGSLNVASLEDVYEDQTHVHIITELCQGGELVNRIGSKHYSERTVGSCAQCFSISHGCLPWLDNAGLMKEVDCHPRIHQYRCARDGMRGGVGAYVSPTLLSPLPLVTFSPSRHIFSLSSHFLPLVTFFSLRPTQPCSRTH